ncbi:MAG: FAD-binding protein [Actinobacteria bacterium]|nr:FAD-binding protein [Actinomycetota bacterium]
MSTLRRGVWTNWAGNQTARPSAVHRPANENELSTIVARAATDRTTVKALGSGHSFTAVSVTDGAMIDMTRLSRLVAVDRATSTVTVEAGITIADLNVLLHGLGLALPNLGDIAYQTISGAIATSTHGTGRALTGIAAQVVGMRVVAGDGSVLDLSPEHHPSLFHAARVGVGALGIVTRVTLRVVPAFRLRAQEGAQRLDDLIDGLDEHVDGNDHFEFFWIPHTKWALTKRNNRTDDEVSIPRPLKHWYAKTFMENYAFGAVCRLGRARPNLIPRLATALPSTGQTTIVDESYRIFASQRLVRFVEMEYALPREACGEALQRVRRMIDERGHMVSFPVEVRFTAPDDVPLSTASGRPSAYIAVHMYKGTPFDAYFRDVAAIMADYDGRPHWGKMHFLGAEELSRLYPQWEAFHQARRCIDPMRTFANAYTARVFGD